MIKLFSLLCVEMHCLCLDLKQGLRIISHCTVVVHATKVLINYKLPDKIIAAMVDNTCKLDFSQNKDVDIVILNNLGAEIIYLFSGLGLMKVISAICIKL